MFTKEFYELFMQIIKSWQVIAAAVVILLYLKIVSYVSKSRHQRRPKEKKIKMKVKPEKAEPAPLLDSEEGDSSSNANDELGLEEA